MLKRKKELAYQSSLEAHFKEISEKNATLKEYYDIINNAGHGIWKCAVGADGHVCSMEGNEKWNEIFGMQDMFLTPEDCLSYFTERLLDKSRIQESLIILIFSRILLCILILPGIIQKKELFI